MCCVFRDAFLRTVMRGYLHIRHLPVSFNQSGTALSLTTIFPAELLLTHDWLIPYLH